VEGNRFGCARQRPIGCVWRPVLWWWWWCWSRPVGATLRRPGRRWLRGDETIPRLKENGPPASGLRFTRSDHEQLFRPTDLTRPATGVSSISASASRRHLHEP